MNGLPAGRCSQRQHGAGQVQATINKDGIGCGAALSTCVCQVAVVILLGVLILNDMIPLATFRHRYHRRRRV